MPSPYLFQSPRLGFRNWIDADLPKLSAINADPEVMEFFPGTLNPEQNAAFIERMQGMLHDKGFCYFAVDQLSNGAFIGFIGLCEQTYEAPFTPCVDIGWRLDKNHWYKGYATEGATRCLEYGFNELGLKNIKSTAPKINLKSIRVMEKIGMHQQLEFKHPRLLDVPRLVDCVCYELNFV